jgi:hypothetical protein
MSRKLDGAIWSTHGFEQKINLKFSFETEMRRYYFEDHGVARRISTLKMILR